jgi:ubiquinol-cytochrome c reductase cytochrome b subunit
VILVLGYLGSQSPDGNFAPGGVEFPLSKVFVSQIFTAYYFFHFLVLMPLLGLIETPLPVPESIATAVLAKRGGAGAPAAAVRAPETRV